MSTTPNTLLGKAMLLNLAIEEAANSAAKLIVNYGKYHVEQKPNQEDKYDEVTDVDYSAQRHIVDTLIRFFPDCGIIAEEEGLCYLSTHPLGLTFTIDPIDGTKEFVRGGNEVSIMIAAFCSGRIIASMILNPYTLESYQLSAVDSKVYRNRCGIVTELSFVMPARKRALLSFEDPRDSRLSSIAMISEPNKGYFGSHLVLSGSYGTNVMKLASNVVSAILTIPANIKPWDEAPSIGILTSLGYKYYVFDKTTRTFDCQDLVFNPDTYYRELTLITHPSIFNEFIQNFE